MSNCFYCFQPKSEAFSWSSIFVEKSKYFCESCSRKITWVEGMVCLGCCRSLKETGYCNDCRKWEETGHRVQNTSFLRYNDFMKQFFSQYKYRGDYELARVLAELLRKRWNIVDKEHVFCPIPLSEERLMERGFNQVTAVLDLLGVTYKEYLLRTGSEKQAKKSQQERKMMENPFYAKDDLSGKSIIIVDDIYTTGSTIYHASKVLQEAGAEQVYSMTFIRA